MKFFLGVNETFNTPCKKTPTLPIYNTKPQKQPLSPVFFTVKLMNQHENLATAAWFSMKTTCRHSSSSHRRRRRTWSISSSRCWARATTARRPIGHCLKALPPVPNVYLAVWEHVTISCTFSPHPWAWAAKQEVARPRGVSSNHAPPLTDFHLSPIVVHYILYCKTLRECQHFWLVTSLSVSKRYHKPIL